MPTRANLNRTFTPPDRNRRASIVESIARLPIPQVLVLAIFFLSTQQIFGAVGIMMQLACTGLLLTYLAVFRARVFVGLIKWWPLMLLPLFAMASAAWSLAPAVSLRYGFQFFITCVTGIVVARSVTPKEYVGLLYSAAALICVISLFAGRYGPAQAGLVNIGLFGSKNEMAYAAQLLLTTSLAVLIDRGQAVGLRLSTLPCLILALFYLITGSAAGATLTAVGGAAVLLAMSTLHIFKLRGRLVIVLMVLVMIPPFVMVRDQLVNRANIFVEDVLDRDMKDLSGRAYLWARADELIRDRPILGHGFRAIFVGDTVEGRGILRRVGQQDGRAWHFHSSYREVAVDMGFVGLTIFCMTLLLTFIALLRRVVLHPTPAYALFLSIYCVILAKTPAEVVIGTFGQSLIFGMSVWAFSKPEGNPQWQGRSYASDGAPLGRRSQRRIVHHPVRVTPPVRPR